jgi:hypothetical protein
MRRESGGRRQALDVIGIRSMDISSGFRVTRRSLSTASGHFSRHEDVFRGRRYLHRDMAKSVTIPNIPGYRGFT